jgi:carboxyl-terminal processing protease
MIDKQRIATSEYRTEGLYRQPWLLGGAAAVVLVLVFSLGVILGYGLGLTSPKTALAQAAPPDIAAPTATPAPDPRGDLDAEMDIFWEAMDHLYSTFYGALPSGKDAAYGAIRGVVALFDDPHTNFMDPEQAKFFQQSIDGAFEGIGARVAWNEERDTLEIVEPYENQPAWNAGLRRGDLVLAVDGESIIGTSDVEAIGRIRGPEGTDVTLTVERPETEETFDVTITRARIELPTIVTDTLGADANIAYVRLNTFNDVAGSLVREAVRDGVRRDAQAIIFDLRGNSGGLVREAIKVANVFVEDEIVLIERERNGEPIEYKTTGRAVTTRLPLVVLVNEASASSSEIVAGALQDLARGILMGTTTFGKGSVQLGEELRDGSVMRVTVAKWFTPKDRTIEDVGLAPDIVVEITDEQREAGEDPQLDAAVAHLEALIASN